MTAMADVQPDLFTAEADDPGETSQTEVVDEPGRSIEYLAGYSDGYRTAMAVLDEAGAFLSATLQPADAVDLAAARADATAYREPDLTGDQLRARAYTSWALPLPADLVGHDSATNHCAADDVTQEAL